MKAAIVPAVNGKWEVKEPPNLEPGPNQVLIKIHVLHRKRKGRFIELMERIPIHVILTRVALVGAATYGLERLEKGSSGAAA
jgi:hypothetical protein